MTVHRAYPKCTVNTVVIVGGNRGTWLISRHFYASLADVGINREAVIVQSGARRALGLDFACTARLGHCQEDSLHCSGSYHSRLCSGHASRKCCIPNSAVSSGSDSRCTNQGGNCQEKTSHCAGSYVSGLCSGSASRKCCLPSSVLGSGISQKCLDCICKHESGCRPLGCHMDVGSLSCGYFQIKSGYWHDCGKPGSSWEACAKSKTCAEECVRRNMRRYGTYCTGKGDRAVKTTPEYTMEDPMAAGSRPLSATGITWPRVVVQPTLKISPNYLNKLPYIMKLM
ncbi:uncharacterized protein LOC121388409 [Gigantopelta aegis]|uniref:uncharacterized protein LOC121388409 n=1 Tax=Gigantopelta aegis TaxID=1735272 RepID=UPI001B88D408|nr:uncharacterized protein LOC121388409 [Gigantopelta aegis]